MSYGLLQDINGDKSQHIVTGFISIGIALILSVITVLYGLGHEIKSSSTIIIIIPGLFTLGGTMLGLSGYVKQRINVEEKSND